MMGRPIAEAISSRWSVVILVGHDPNWNALMTVRGAPIGSLRWRAGSRLCDAARYLERLAMIWSRFASIQRPI